MLFTYLQLQTDFLQMLSNRVSHRKLFREETSTSKKRKLSEQLRVDNWTSNTAKKCRKVKKNQTMGDAVGQNSTLPIDYISQLPEHIIYHILAFLSCPKDVARTSALSTKWITIWKSFLTFDFDQKNFKSQGKSAKKEFVEFVESSLATRLAPLEFIQKFRLSMTSFDAKKMKNRLDRWLASVVTKNVREIEIHLVTKKIRRYTVPQSILATESLTTLKLCGCSLNICGNMKLSNLKQFSMKDMHIDTNIIQSFISTCPLIEDLRLVRCRGFDSLQISKNVKLNRVEIHECHLLRHVEIFVPNLKTFWLCGMLGQSCTIDLKKCHDLRSLTLKDTKMTDTLLQDQISMFPLLENLVLKDCNTLERITILSKKLQRLSLLQCRKLIETIVDSPNLHFFEFTGNRVPVFCINAPNLNDVKMCFTAGAVAGTKDVFNVHEVFGKITELKGLKLVLRRKKEIVIYEELTDVVPDIEFSPSKDFKLDLKSSSFSLIKRMNNLLSDTHPTSITVFSPPSGELLKFLHEKMLNQEKSLDCCTYYSRKCWQHYLRNVNISELQGRDPENPLFPSSKTLKRSTFLLEWGSMEDDK